MNGKLKIRCSASIYDIYWQSTEVSTEEDRPRVIHYEPAATIVGINYLQPPPNFQTGQKKPDGQVGVKGKKASSIISSCFSLTFLVGLERDAFGSLVRYLRGGEAVNILRKYVVARSSRLFIEI